MPAANVVVLSAARIPISRYGGSFKDVHPAELGAVSARDDRAHRVIGLSGHRVID
jgi:acetyl-CoA acetyltransferase